MFDGMPTPQSGHENYRYGHPNPIQSSVLGGSTSFSEQNLDGRPQPYGFHNLNRQSVFLADGTEHSYFTLPADYPLEQATPTMSPSAAEHISVTPQSSVAAQAAGLAIVPSSKANNTVDSDSLFVHILQLPTTAQDTSNVCKEMHVYDIYEEDMSYLNGMDEHLAKPFHKASDNASSEDFTDVTCTRAPSVFVNLSIKCSVRNNRTELPSLPDSELCGEQRKPQHGNNQQRNFLLAEMRREVWDPGTSTSLHSSMANLCNQGGTYGREVWDPGDTNLHVLFMIADGATELQCTDADQSTMVPILAMHFGEKRATISEATMASQDSPASLTPLLMHVDDMQLSTSVQVAPGMFEEIPVYDDYDYEEDGNGSLNFFVELCDTGGQQKQYNSETPIYDHEEPHCAAKLESDNELLAVCFNNTSDNAFSQEGTTYFRFPHGPLIHDVRSIELTKEKSTQAVSILYVQATVCCDDWRSEINIKKREVLINKHDMVYPCDLNTDKVPLSSGPCIWDPGIDLFSYKKLYHFIWIPLSAIPLIHQLHPKNFCSWWDFSLKKGRQVQWDPGIKLLLYEFWRLKTLSKGTEYAMRHLFSVKFGTHNFTYFSDTADIMCCPLPNLLQHGRNVTEVLRFWRSTFNSMHHCQICHICTTRSFLFHCHGIPLWLIHFQVP